MSDIQDLLNRPPDVAYTDAQAVADGVLVDLTEHGVHIWYEGDQITRITAALLTRLAAFNPGGSPREQAVALQALLGFIVNGAAGEGEPEGYLLESRDTFHALGDSRVWLQPNGGGWTVMLPEDH